VSEQNLAQPVLTLQEEIKVPQVICRQKVQEFGDLQIPAPYGVTMDPCTGKLKQKIVLEPKGEPQIRVVQIIPDKIIVIGVVPVLLLVDGKLVIQKLEVPFQGILKCPGALPGDLVQLHDFQVEGFAVAPIQIPEDDCDSLRLHLILKVIVHYCIVVAKESILRVQAAKPC